MVSFVRTALCSCLVAAGAASGCTPDDEPGPYVHADTPIETDHGQFAISFRAAEGRAWPEFLGPATFAAHIDMGPDPAPNDPQFKGDVPVPPFELKLGPARPPWARGPMALTARVWPVAVDGRKWMVAFNFKAAGDWVFPLTVRDALGRTDATEVVFHIEEERD